MSSCNSCEDRAGCRCSHTYKHFTGSRRWAYSVSSFVDVGREAERGVKGELPPPPPLEQYKSDI